jgi:hypothetical protein
MQIFVKVTLADVTNPAQSSYSLKLSKIDETALRKAITGQKTHLIHKVNECTNKYINVNQLTFSANNNNCLKRANMIGSVVWFSQFNTIYDTCCTKCSNKVKSKISAYVNEHKYGLTSPLHNMCNSYCTLQTSPLITF